MLIADQPFVLPSKQEMIRETQDEGAEEKTEGESKEAKQEKDEKEGESGDWGWRGWGLGGITEKLQSTVKILIINLISLNRPKKYQNF